MSGGYFDYQQRHLENMATMIDDLIASNDREYATETITRFREAARSLRDAAAMTRRVDWLVSGDDGEESFHRRWAEEIAKFES